MDYPFRCTHELITNFRGKGNPIRGFFKYLESGYIEFVQGFNWHCVLFGETGFRLTDRTVNDIQNIADVGRLNQSINSPIIHSIKYNSIYKFFRALPKQLDPPLRVAYQPTAECLISAEFDKNADGFTPKAIFARAVESSHSKPSANHQTTFESLSLFTCIQKL